MPSSPEEVRVPWVANQHAQQEISFSAIISALSFAIDLTDGAVPGHALRSCVLGMRIGREMGLLQAELGALYPALLLKDIGCSNNAARMCQIVGGDERKMKRFARIQAGAARGLPSRKTMRMLWKHVLPDGGAARRTLRIFGMALRQKQASAELIGLRCERGADIAQKLGLSDETAQAIRSLDERWDGSGYPDRLAGEAIPQLARILAVAQHLDIFAAEGGTAYAVETLVHRSGLWFDPGLVATVQLMDSAALWTRCGADDDLDATRELALTLEPDLPGRVQGEEIDRICEAFADVVDAKSPFTFRHSVGVAEVARAMCLALNLPLERLEVVRRAALLHDLGKLSIPNSILDKAGEMSHDDWEVVMGHPALSREILRRIPGFGELADIAGAHHERLDGSGYPDRRRGVELSLEARIVAAADAYRAMTEGRPYRAGISHKEAIVNLWADTPQRFDSRCVEALDRALAPVYGGSDSGGRPAHSFGSTPARLRKAIT